MSASTTTFQFQNVWEEKSDELAAEIMQFWLDHQALNQGEAERRVNEVVLVAREPAGKLAAVSTVRLGFDQSIGQNFYYYRAFVAPSWRRSGLALELTRGIYGFFNGRFDASDPEAAIGVLVVVESRILRETKNEAIWPGTGFVFVGRSPAGHHRRVHYFDGARIKP